MRHPRDKYGKCQQCPVEGWQKFDARVMMVDGEEGSEYAVPKTQRTGVECGHTYYCETGSPFPESFLDSIGEVLEARQEYIDGLRGMSEEEFDDLSASERKLVLAICSVEPIEDAP